MKALLELMFAEWRILKSKKEIEIMEEYAKKGRQYTIFYAGKKLIYIIKWKNVKLQNVFSIIDSLV